MKLIFDQYSLPVWTVASTVNAGKHPSMPVVITAMDEVMWVPWRYLLLTSKNLPSGTGQ